MGRLLVPTQDLKINRQGNITIPTLISSAGNSENYVFSSTEDIYFEAEVYLNSYNTIGGILGALSTTYNIVNEYAFIISDINEVGGRGIPQGAVGVYNGERGQSLSCYYTDGAIVDLNQWTKIVAKRTNGNWSIFINDIECSVARATDAGVPNDQFGNSNLPIYIGRLEADNVNFDGQIKNVILNNKPKKNNRTSIKKQNQTILKPYSIDGGSSIYNSQNVYTFKGGGPNTLSTVFNISEFQGGGSSATADLIFIGPSINSLILYFRKTGPGAGWKNSAGSNATNQIINTNDIILFAPRSYKEINVGSGAIIQRYYQGKININ